MGEDDIPLAISHQLQLEEKGEPGQEPKSLEGQNQVQGGDKGDAEKEEGWLQRMADPSNEKI